MTKIAVISDIHGNSHALEAVLADIATQRPDFTVNLGDNVSGPFDAGRTADMLIAADMPSIAGNHERWLFAPPKGEHGFSELAALKTLTSAHLDWLRTLPATRVVADEVFMCHATPTDDMTFWLDDMSPEGLQYQASREHIERVGEGCLYPIILCGHTHIPRLASLSGNRLVVNPGSVGYPGFRYGPENEYRWAVGSPHARYAIISKTSAGWSADFRVIAYDFAAAAAVAREYGAPQVADMLETGWP